MAHSTDVSTRRSALIPALITGLAVHAVAGLIFAALSMADLEGCDRSDSLASALSLAVAADIVLTLAAFWTTRRAHDPLRDTLAGWALSLLPALATVLAGLVYINSLPTGCPT